MSSGKKKSEKENHSSIFHGSLLRLNLPDQKEKGEQEKEMELLLPIQVNPLFIGVLVCLLSCVFKVHLLVVNQSSAVC